MRNILLMLTGMSLMAVTVVYADNVTSDHDRTYGNPNQQKHNKPHVVTTGEDKNIVEDIVATGGNAIFAELERRLITKYYGEHREFKRDYEYEYEGGRGKGNKNKKKGLPPGIAKKLERGGTMPPGIAKQFLPYDLERELPPLPHGYERRVVGADVLLVETATGVIADIIADAVLGD